MLFQCFSMCFVLFLVLCFQLHKNKKFGKNTGETRVIFGFYAKFGFSKSKSRSKNINFQGLSGPLEAAKFFATFCWKSKIFSGAYFCRFFRFFFELTGKKKSKFFFLEVNDQKSQGLWLKTGRSLTQKMEVPDFFVGRCPRRCPTRGTAIRHFPAGMVWYHPLGLW